MSFDLATLYTNALTGTGTISDIILVSVNDKKGIMPQNTTKKRGFVFDIPTEESVSLLSDVTDHYLEDNTAIHDQVSKKPRTITTGGYIGELNNVTPEALEPLEAVVDRLGLASAFIPELTNSALRAYNTAEQIYRVAKKAVTAIESAMGFEQVTRQMETYVMFRKWWEERTIFKVQTPFEYFQNAVIQSLRATQTENDKNTTYFEITFKEIRIAKTIFNSQNSIKDNGRAPTSSVETPTLTGA